MSSSRKSNRIEATGNKSSVEEQALESKVLEIMRSFQDRAITLVSLKEMYIPNPIVGYPANKMTKKEIDSDNCKINCKRTGG